MFHPPVVPREEEPPFVNAAPSTSNASGATPQVPFAAVFHPHAVDLSPGARADIAFGWSASVITIGDVFEASRGGLPKPQKLH